MNVNFSNKHIVAVDDNETNLLLLQSLLEDANYTFISLARSAKELYKILKEETVDLILLDVMMPEIDGIEACQTVRDSSKYSHIPIIMVTADTSDRTLQKSFEAGANDYITKPVNRINLNVRVENALIHRYKDTLLINQNRLLAVEDTVKMLAHQWRQPISVISTTIIDLTLSSELGTINNRDLKTSLQRMSKSTQDLSKTLDMFCKVSQNDTNTSLQNINETVSMSVNLIQSKLEAYGVTFEVNLAKMNDISFISNELIKILLGLYVNAYEAYKRQNGNKKKVICITTSQSNVSTTIEIKDSAGGVDEKILPKIFDPYTSTKEEKKWGWTWAL